MMSFDPRYMKNISRCKFASSVMPDVANVSKSLKAIRQAKTIIVTQLASQGISASDRSSLVDLATQLEKNI